MDGTVVLHRINQTPVSKKDIPKVDIIIENIKVVENPFRMAVMKLRDEVKTKYDNILRK